MGVTLPIPVTAAKSQCEKVSQYIRDEITSEGPIPFSRFMHLALYTPGLGYYSAGSQKFGEAGDFVTAPEISSLFSRCLARQCQAILSEMGEGNILELGAGSGVMALHLLEELQKQDCLPKQYYILEVSAELKDRQQSLFKNTQPSLLDRITWLDRLPSTPFQGIILGNEVIDAMPVSRFIFSEGLKEFYVDYDKNKNEFFWQLGNPSEDLISKVNALDIAFPENYESEINLSLESWLRALNECLEKGAMLFIDYGYPRREYYHPDRSMGTLMCYFRHRRHSNPLIYPGIQDITAHVDFTAIAEAASHHQLNVAGFTHQASFLMNCGITDYLNDIDNDIEHFQLTQQIKKLVMPNEMGELFKVIALTKNHETTLLGFTHNNQLARL